jgi:hypothetical protein
MRRALVQAQALANVDQTQLGTLQVEAKEHVDGLLDRRWPRRCPDGVGMVVSHTEILFHYVEHTITPLRTGSQAICGRGRIEVGLSGAGGERCDRIGRYRQGTRISGTELLRGDARNAGFLCTT